MTDSIYPLWLTTGKDRMESILNGTRGTIAFDSSQIYEGHESYEHPWYSIGVVGAGQPGGPDFRPHPQLRFWCEYAGLLDMVDDAMVEGLVREMDVHGRQ